MFLKTYYRCQRGWIGHPIKRTCFILLSMGSGAITETGSLSSNNSKKSEDHHDMKSLR